MKCGIIAGLRTLLIVAFVSAGFGQAFTAADFEQFTRIRIGNGKPVYWYCVGEIYEYPSGKLVAKVEGIDTARLIVSESGPNRKLQLSRKIFFYRDPATGEILRELNGMKVEPIAYPYQQITYEFKNGKMTATVVQGKQPRVQTIESSGDYQVPGISAAPIGKTIKIPDNRANPTKT